ncbi:hypothetical protein SLH49_03660 [Cognatiyoonia sp. IB215446]|uniref:hypothetical protein n=1 Tax=Cognatiyoonia sp. IB215446 TaxID=3097355 RepID=UPI002A10617F|nr:hypothetical protein [Cognatiyoonia sp. IB215446]MDX8347074.1 hypothetical protein [Cognatiyoonia sp. IB215446]
MGREAVAVCHWQGEIAEAKLHLDSKMLSLRGEIRVDILRGDIRDVVLRDDGVRVLTPGSELFMEFSAKDAGLWQKALLKKPPTLAEKLGVSAEKPAFVLGAVDDAPLAEALAGATVSAVDAAPILLAIVMTPPDLEEAADLALAHPDRHIWMVYRKGKVAEVGDTLIRTHMRDRGFIDSKTSAVSDQLTATRYRLRAK